MAIFTGAGVAIATPFHQDGSVNYEEFGRLIEFQIASGISALVVVGTTGEGSTLSDKLTAESSQMQNESLSLAKAEAKKAETKLCFPLMLLLVSLIIVCSAPALMQM